LEEVLPKLQVRPLNSLREFQACECIQEEVWGAPGVTAEVISVTAKYGGVVLGAFAGRKLVGFLFAFLARRRGQLIHWSHMMAVSKGYRDLGLGFKMKLAHRKLALVQGVKAICWTYDPLMSRNATLNIARLGAEIDEYQPNVYGRFPSRIERGLESDRFVVNWKIGSSRVERRLRDGAPVLSPYKLPRVNDTAVNKSGLLDNQKIHWGLRERTLLVEIPASTDEMRARDLKLAARWRVETRRVFLTYFRAGYRVAGFFPPTEATARRCFYVLRRTGSETKGYFQH
jgi:predicted GNAT superfamily acetyltransferase